MTKFEWRHSYVSILTKTLGREKILIASSTSPIFLSRVSRLVRTRSVSVRMGIVASCLWSSASAEEKQKSTQSSSASSTVNWCFFETTAWAEQTESHNSGKWCAIEHELHGHTTTWYVWITWTVGANLVRNDDTRLKKVQHKPPQCRVTPLGQT